MLKFEIVKDRFERFIQVNLQGLRSTARYRVIRAMLMEIRKEASGLLRGKATKDVERKARKVLWYTTKQKNPRVGFIRPIPKEADRKKPGVGLSHRNIHWFVLGTKDRYTRDGKYRGKMAPYFVGVLPQAVVSAQERALKRAEEALKKELQKINARR